MSLNLDSVAAEDLALTPTPGSPRPYIPADHHNRLNSIQLSSDASGEYSTTHSPRAFLDPPGEALSELRNALNPPWLHGLTGTPPSLVSSTRHDHSARWMEEALGSVEPTSGTLTQVGLDRLSLGQGAPPVPPSVARAASQTVLGKSFQPSVRRSGSIPDGHPKTLMERSSRPPHRLSPFDKSAVIGNNPASASQALVNSHPSSAAATADYTLDPRSGDASSEEEESWPMPDTPFLGDEGWNVVVNPGHPASAYPSLAHEDPGTKLLQQLLQSSNAKQAAPAPIPRKTHVGGGGRAPGLIRHHRVKEGERRVGRCKMYNCDKGVGFLIDDRLDEVPYDVKIHWTDLYSDQEFKSLAKGELVEYTLNITANGYSASYVTGPDGRPVMGAEQAIVQASRQTSYKLFKAGALPVKTYRSKWESVSPSLVVSSERPLSSTSSTFGRPSSVPSKTQNVLDRSPAVLASVPPAPGNGKSIKIKLPPARSELQATDSLPGGHMPRSVRESPVLPSEHAKPPDHGRVLGSPYLQYSTAGWGGMPSPLSSMHTPGSLVSCASSQNPLFGLPHAALTPNSLESFDPASFATIQSQYMSGRPLTSPGLQMATLADSSRAILPNQILGNTNSLNQRDLQTFFAERQLLLQHQAALMNLYQNVNATSPALSASTTMVNPLLKPHPAGSYGGLYDRTPDIADMNQHLFNLLPPIALPGGKLSLDASAAVSHHTQGSGHSGPQVVPAWRPSEVSELKLESAALRAEAQAFMPSGGEHVHPTAFTCSRKEKGATLHVNGVKQLDTPFYHYQVPGRRSVSDPASSGAVLTKKLNLQTQARQAKVNTTSSTNRHSHPAKVANTKRVTFAEQITAPRRIVSCGAAPSEVLDSFTSPVEAESSDGEGEVALSTCGAPFSPEPGEGRRGSVDVTSVDIAMERLREAAAPGRLSQKAISPPSPQEVLAKVNVAQAADNSPRLSAQPAQMKGEDACFSSRTVEEGVGLISQAKV